VEVCYRNLYTFSLCKIPGHNQGQPWYPLAIVVPYITTGSGLSGTTDSKGKHNRSAAGTEANKTVDLNITKQDNPPPIPTPNNTKKQPPVKTPSNNHFAFRPLPEIDKSPPLNKTALKDPTEASLALQVEARPKASPPGAPVSSPSQEAKFAKLPPLPRSSPSTQPQVDVQPAAMEPRNELSKVTPQEPKREVKPTLEIVDRTFQLAPNVELGEYILLAPIAQSLMGEVWKARNNKIGKWAAIKVPSHEITGRSGAAERFLQEARAVNEIRHRNIVDIFDFGSLPDGRPYYVMELLEGKPLSLYLKDHSPLTFQEILDIFAPVCQALQSAHDHGIVHRDIKSDNIFLILDKKNPPFIKVLDFGIAKLHGVLSQDREDVTLPGAVYGTPAYMSPEQCQGASQVTHLADIYSLGVVLYEMITGRLPFLEPSGNIGMLLVKHITAKPLPPSKVVKNRFIIKEIDELLLRALAKDPKRRPVSSEAFSAELFKAAKPLRFEESASIKHAEPILNTEPWVPGVSPAPLSVPEIQLVGATAPKEFLALPTSSELLQEPVVESTGLAKNDSPTEAPILPADIEIDPELKLLAVKATAKVAAGAPEPERHVVAQRLIATDLIVFRPPPQRNRPFFLVGGVLLFVVGWAVWPTDGPTLTNMAAPLESKSVPIITTLAPVAKVPTSVEASSLSHPPEKISFRFDSKPTGAKVFLDGSLLGVTPIEKEVLFSVVGSELKIAKAGFETVEIKFTPNSPYENKVSLLSKEKASKNSRKVKSKASKIKDTKDTKRAPKDSKNVVVNPFQK
jgi:serine/threonine protein kinase